MANAFSLNLIPEGYVPSDGNCMFHAVAQSLSDSVNQLDVRRRAAKWLEENQWLQDDVFWPDFVHDMTGQEYLHGLQGKGNAWGYHVALIGITNAFDVTIRVVSREAGDMQYDIHNGQQDSNVSTWVMNLNPTIFGLCRWMAPSQQIQTMVL